MHQSQHDRFMHKTVEIAGLTRNLDLNGKQGVVFMFDPQKHRYGVLVGSDRYSIGAGNLRLRPLRPPDAEEEAPKCFNYWDADHGDLVRTCYNGCGAEAMVRNRKSRKDAEQICSRMLPACGRCGEAFYCSRTCQKQHWPSHKEACEVVTNASAFFKSLASEASNVALCSFVEEFGGAAERGIVHFICPSLDILKDMQGNRPCNSAMHADMQWIPLDRMQIYIDAVRVEVQAKDFWEEVLRAASVCDVSWQICVMLSVTLSDGSLFCRPAVVPRFFGPSS